MLLICLEEVKLRLLLNLDIQVVELFDRRIACKEVCRARAEGNDLQMIQSFLYSRNRKEIMDHVRDIIRVTDRIFRNIGADIAECEIVACVQHAAVRIASALNAERILGFFCSRAEHLRAVEMLRKKSLGNFRAEVAEIDAERIAAILSDILEGVDHVNFTLDDRDRTLIEILRVVFLCVGLCNSLSSVNGKRRREAVAGYSHKANFDLRNVVHI